MKKKALSLHHQDEYAKNSPQLLLREDTGDIDPAKWLSHTVTEKVITLSGN